MWEEFINVIVSYLRLIPDNEQSVLSIQKPIMMKTLKSIFDNDPEWTPDSAYRHLSSYMTTIQEEVLSPVDNQPAMATNTELLEYEPEEKKWNSIAE